MINIRRMSVEDVEALVVAPVNDKLLPEQRFESSLTLSELVVRMVTFVICHVIVDYGERLKDERMSVASALLQRVTSTHLCNQKLTQEGIVMQYEGEEFELHDEYRTMTLTRSVYEHLVMFYFLYQHPKSEEERNLVWNYWKTNSMKNGCVEAVREGGKLNIKQVSYNQSWKYLFDKDEMMLLYRHLSIHCHPVYDGLMQYQNQAQSDEGYDGIPLYLSSCFLAYMCRMFLRMIPNGNKLLRQHFSKQELKAFNALAQLPDEE